MGGCAGVGDRKFIKKCAILTRIVQLISGVSDIKTAFESLSKNFTCQPLLTFASNEKLS